MLQPKEEAMLKTVLLILLCLILGLIVVIALRPNEVSITRTGTVPGPPEVAFGLVNDFREWGKWSPWEKRDPNMTREFSDQTAGTGATYYWKGNSEVGEGRMTIQESHPHEHIGILLEFLDPFPSASQTDFRFAPAGDGTQVTWTMSMELSFMMKAFTLFMDMDAAIGKDYEQGLEQMAAAAKTAVAEREAAAEPVAVP